MDLDFVLFIYFNIFKLRPGPRGLRLATPLLKTVAMTNTQCQKLGKKFTGPMYKLLLRFMII